MFKRRARPGAAGAIKGLAALRGAYGRLHSYGALSVARRGRRRRVPDRHRRARHLRHGDRALHPQSHDHLADRRRHLHHRRRHLHWQRLCVDDARARQRRNSAAAYRAARSLLAGACDGTAGARLLRRAVDGVHTLLVPKLCRGLEIRHRVARAPLDSLFVDADRPGSPRAAICRRASGACDRPRGLAPAADAEQFAHEQAKAALGEMP